MEVYLGDPYHTVCASWFGNIIYFRACVWCIFSAKTILGRFFFTLERQMIFPIGRISYRFSNIYSIFFIYIHLTAGIMVFCLLLLPLLRTMWSCHIDDIKFSSKKKTYWVFLAENMVFRKLFHYLCVWCLFRSASFLVISYSKKKGFCYHLILYNC